MEMEVTDACVEHARCERWWWGGVMVLMRRCWRRHDGGAMAAAGMLGRGGGGGMAAGWRRGWGWLVGGCMHLWLCQQQL